MDQTPPIQQYLQLRSEFLGYLYAITKDVELSEEVYQNAAVVVIEKLNLEEIRDFRAWAKEVVRRQALNAIRSRAQSARFGQPIDPALLEAISESFLQDQDEVTRVTGETKALNSCLDGLTKTKRKMVTLRYETGSTFEEIAEQLESTPVAVQRALSRIRKSLHDCVQRRMQLSEGT